MRLVNYLLILLALYVAGSAAANAQNANDKNTQPSAAATAAGAAKPLQQSVAAPGGAAVNNTNSTMEVESLVSGDVAEDSATNAAAMGEVTTAGTGRLGIAAYGRNQRGGNKPSKGKKDPAGKSGSKDSSGSDSNDDDDGSDGDGGDGDGSQSDADEGEDSSSGDKDNNSGKHGKHPSSCPLWGLSFTDQGITSEDRPAATNIFSELTVDEYNAVLNYLYSKDKLGLIDIISSDPNKTLTVANYIHAIHMEAPPKHEVLNYLDNKGPRPARKARAILVLGHAHPPVVREVLVTLHDEGDSITVSHLQKVNILSTKVATIPYNQRPQGPLDENGVIVALGEAADTLNVVFSEAFDGFTYGDDCDDKCIDFSLTYSQRFLEEGVQRASYVQMYWYTQTDGEDAANYLHPIPMQALVGSTDKNLENWSILRIWFAGKFFDTPEELAHAWKHDTKGLRSNFEWEFPKGDETLYATFIERPGKKRGADQPVGPIPWEPYGRRFTISHGNQVSWLGWSLYVGYLPHYGGRFWDVRFKGHRIAYEMALQEAMALYGAADLTQANTVFLDASFGMGYNLRELNQGLDCPMTAAFMNADIFYAGMSGPTTYKNAICVFEHNPDMPVLRHYSSSFKYYGAVPGAQLVIRMITTVYNYDYIQDLMLNIDGTIDVKVTTSGYIQAAAFRSFYPQHFGFPLATNVSGTVHTHVLAWRVDLDIAGTENSLNMLDFKSAKYDNGLGGEIFMNKYDSKLVETEDESGYIQKMYDPKMPIIINEHAHNKWGSPRGYKVQLTRPLANLEPNHYSRSAGLGFWKWNFVATKRKDDETQSSSIYTQSDLASPPSSLPDYVNGESIRKKDLVVWINSGLYHVPMAEDAPVTPSSGHNTLGFSLIPYNWANENPATDMAGMFTVGPEDVNSTVPDVKKVLHKCKPSYTPVKFATSGFEGITNTDEEVAMMGTQNAEDEDDNGSADNNNSGGQQGSGKQRGKRSKKDAVTAVIPRTTQTDLPAGSAMPAAAPAQVRPRTCRRSKRWGAC